MKLGKALKNMSKDAPAKTVKKTNFSKIKLTGLLMKKRPSFPSKIYSVFYDLNAFSGNT